MKTFYLVRHAHAQWQPDENRPLSTVGKRDAEKIAELLLHLPIGAIYSSPYRRAVQTIQPLAVKIGRRVSTVPDLRERRLGRFNGDDFENAVLATWADFTFAFDDGESNEAAQSRAVDFVQGLQKGGGVGPFVLSTHGNLLALIVNCFDPALGYGFWQTVTMPDVVGLTLDGGKLISLNRLWPGSD